ncbi:nudix hydrolase [Providencia sneebia DSM 19967]|uniref:Nudix hydrolase n=1 Tax=Providencia sneebia DSM 19967 TaxID=1141660 RepID=K8WMV3_9GAMM|nr:nudix hydrolase [Providencia sneebia DSM 19967]
MRIRCYFANFSGKPQPAAEIEELAWFDSQDISRCSATAAIILKKLHADGLVN